MPENNHQEGKHSEGKQPDNPHYFITPDNVLSFLDGKSEAKEELALQCIEMWAAQLVSDVHFLSLPREQAIQILRRDGLNMKETEVFARVLAYGKHQLSLNGGDPDSHEQLSKEIQDLLPCVRFPVFSTSELAALVAPAQVIEQKQLLQLFTYVSARSSFAAFVGNPLFDTVQCFSAVPRVPRKMPAGWVWICDQCKTYTLNNRTLCAKCEAPKHKDALAYPNRNYGGGLNFYSEQTTTTTTTTTDPSSSSSSSSSWNCMECTLENPGSAVECSLCHAMNPASIVALAESGEGGWKCALCTLENHVGVLQCMVCQTPRAVSDEQQPSSSSSSSSGAVVGESKTSPASDTVGGLLDSVDQEKQQEILTKIQAKQDFIWLKNKHVLGAQQQSSLQCSLRHMQDPMPVATMSELGWLCVPLVGVYGDPYEVSHPRVVVELPCQDVKSALGHLPDDVVAAVCQSVPTKPEHAMLPAVEADVEVVEEVEASVVVAPAGAGVTVAAAVAGGATQPAATTTASTLLVEEEKTDVLELPDKPLEFFVLVYDYLERIHANDLPQFNIINHIWCFGETLEGKLNQSTNEQNKVFTGLFQPFGVRDVLGEELKSGQKEQESDGDAMAVDRLSWRFVSLHGLNFSPDNCNVYVDIASPFVSYYSVTHTEQKCIVTFSVIPVLPTLSQQIQQAVKSSDSLEEFVLQFRPKQEEQGKENNNNEHESSSSASTLLYKQLMNAMQPYLAHTLQQSKPN